MRSHVILPCVLWLILFDRYGRAKLGIIYLARELAQRKLATYPPGTVPVLIVAVHPGSVDTEIQKNCESGPIAKAKRLFARLNTKSDERGAEACLWAATCTDINKSNWKQYQVSRANLTCDTC